MYIQVEVEEMKSNKKVQRKYEVFWKEVFYFRNGLFCFCFVLFLFSLLFLQHRLCVDKHGGGGNRRAQ